MLNQYNNDEYNPGTTVKKTLWYFTNMFFFKTMLPFPSSFKVKILKLFGVKIGQGVVIKPKGISSLRSGQMPDLPMGLFGSRLLEKETLGRERGQR